MMSLPLYRIVYFFYDLERLFRTNFGNLDQHYIGACREFLLKIVAPLLANDRELSERYGGAYWVVHATKAGGARAVSSPLDGAMRCPRCHESLAAGGQAYSCAACGTRYPVVSGVPLLADAYPRYYDLLTGQI
jgi:hypothetical protein